MVPGIYIIRVSEELLENEIKKIYTQEKYQQKILKGNSQNI